MSKYNFNIQDFIYDYLPPAHREKRQVVELLEALLQPLQEVNEILDDFVDIQRIISRANGRFIVMREALIQLTGISGITISQISLVSGYYFLESEATPVYFYTSGEATPVYFTTSSEGVSVDGVYTIGVPSASYSAAVESEIREYVSIFGLPFTDFNVTSI